MTDKSFGHTGGFFVFGEVVNRKDDPTQTGKAKVRWNIGGINQSQMSESDLPWSGALFPVSNPSLSGTGGPHTGLREGSKVVGISPSGDGQDVIMLGTVVSAGKGGTDGSKTFDSDIPIPAKDQSTGGQTQPKSGDQNGVVTNDSIVKYGQDQGGGAPAASAGLDDSIGSVGTKIGA